MEIRHLKTFIHIVKLGNFSQAAKFLGYTQSSVTSHIQLLEKELHTTLFERLGSQITLTTDGERFYDYAEKIITLAEDAKNMLASSQVPSGPLIVGIPESVCTFHVANLLRDYSLLYPDVELNLKFGVSSDFRSLLRKNIMDIAFFLETTVTDADLISKLLWPEPIVLVAPPDHPLAKLDKIEPAHLNNQTLILVEAGSNYRTTLEKNLEKAKVHCKTILEIGQIQTIKQLLLSNLGITLLPLISVKDEIEAGKLVVLPWQGPEFQVNAHLVYHKDKWISHPMRAFMQMVQERLIVSG